MDWSSSRVLNSNALVNSVFAVIPYEIHVLLLSHLSKKRIQGLQRVCYLWGYLIASGLTQERIERSAIYVPIKRERTINKKILNTIKSVGKKLGFYDQSPLYKCLGIEEKRLDSHGNVHRERFIPSLEGHQSMKVGAVEAHRLVISSSYLPFKKSFLKSLSEDRTITHIEIALPTKQQHMIMSIFAALRINQSLTHFSLANHAASLSHYEAQGLISFLKDNPILRHFDFKHQGIMDNDVPFLAQALENNKALTSLRLKGGTLLSEGIFKLAKAIKTSAVTSLYLEKCYILNEKEEVIAALGALLEGPTALNKFHISCRLVSRNKESINKNTFCEALKSNKTLEHLNIKGNFLGESGLMALSTALTVHPSLKHLHLECCYFTEEIKAAFLQAIRESTSLQVLKICRVELLTLDNLLLNFQGRRLKFRPYEMKSFSKLLPETITTTTTLTRLDLAKNVFGESLEQIAEALQDNETIRYIDLSHTYSGKPSVEPPSQKVMKAFKRLLQSNTPLISLNLSGINFGAALGFYKLTEGLKFNQRLAYLGLNSCQLRDIDAKSLADALKVNLSLTDLNLMRNHINNTGCERLAEALRSNSSLTHLDLSLNPIGDTGRGHLLNLLKVNSILTRLDFYTF